MRSGRKLALVALWTCVGAQTAAPAPAVAASAADSWVVLASDALPWAAARRKEELSPRLAGIELLVLNSSDCANLRPGLLLVAARDAALPLVRAREVVPDAYLRPCQRRVPSPAQWGLDAVDRSFVRQRADPINWTPKDAVTRVGATLPDGGVLMIRPYRIDDREDPREGLRTAVDLLSKPAARARTLMDDCSFPQLSVDGAYAAVACAVGMKAEHLDYRTTLYHLAAGDAAVASWADCAAPRLSAERHQVSCLKSSRDGNPEAPMRRVDVRF